MSLILLADDSPHAQRMGAQILGEEGYEVLSARTRDAALAQLAKTDPDVVIADVSLPGGGGVELCRWVKAASRHARVILAAGMLESFDEAEARAAGCDAILRKPFEASLVVEAVRPLIEQASRMRVGRAEPRPEQVEELVRRAVEAELPRLVQDVTAKVLDELRRAATGTGERRGKIANRE